MVDGFRAVPVDEKLLDGFALGVAANSAFAAMALEAGLMGEVRFDFGLGAGCATGSGLASAKQGFCVRCRRGGHCRFLL